MSPVAITVMVLAMILLWGGLVVVVLFLRANPETDIVEPDDLVADDVTRERQAHPTRDT